MTVAQSYDYPMLGRLRPSLLLQGEHEVMRRLGITASSALALWALPALGRGVQVSGVSFNFSAAPFVELTFTRLAPTHYSSTANELRCEVRQSASFRLYPLAQVTKVAGVSFAWRFQGGFNVASSRHEERSQGDDAKLRIGLLEHGAAPLLPFFAPGWVRLAAEHLQAPADRMTCLIAGGLHREGEGWQSPQAQTIRHIAVQGQQGVDGWQQVRYHFDEPLAIVGLMIGADGDDTASNFHSSLRNLVLLPPQT